MPALRRDLAPQSFLFDPGLRTPPEPREDGQHDRCIRHENRKAVHVGQEGEGDPAEMSHRRGLLYHAPGVLAKEKGTIDARVALRGAVYTGRDRARSVFNLRWPAPGRPRWAHDAGSGVRRARRSAPT